MATVSNVDARDRLSAFQLATLIEDSYGVPWDMLVELARKVAFAVANVAARLVDERTPPAEFAEHLIARDDWLDE